MSKCECLYLQDLGCCRRDVGGETNSLCGVWRPSSGREPNMQRVSSQQGSSQRPDGFLTLYRNTIRPAGPEGGGGGRVDGRVPAVVLQPWGLKIEPFFWGFTCSWTPKASGRHAWWFVHTRGGDRVNLRCLEGQKENVHLFKKELYRVALS